MSRFTTSLACSWMYCRRGSTASPIKTENRASAAAASSIVTCFRSLRSGSMVVSQSSSAFLPPAPFVPREEGPLVPEPLPQFLALPSRVRVVGFFPPPNLVQGRLGDVHVARVDHGPHVAEEEGEQEGCDVLAVHVRIRHCDDLVVADLREVELVPDARADRGDERPDFLVLRHLIEPRLLHVDDFSAKRKDGLEFL